MYTVSESSQTKCNGYDEKVGFDVLYNGFVFFFFSSRRRHTRFDCDWSSDVCSSDLTPIRRAPHSATATTGICVASAGPGSASACDGRAGSNRAAMIAPAALTPAATRDRKSVV